MYLLTSHILLGYPFSISSWDISQMGQKTDMFNQVIIVISGIY